MRDAEVADIYGDGNPAIVVATHDQGVVAALRPRANGEHEVIRLDAMPNTFIHEIEIGDLNGNGTLEVYATPSEPNRLGVDSQHGEVVRYVPKDGEGRVVVADLGNRHAKEIYVGDVDGDGRDELYVAVEALTSGSGPSLRVIEPVEIRRYDEGTAPDARVVIATLDDRFCRFLTAGDVDGDGKRELVAAGFRSGVWLLRPGSDPRAAWNVENIDRDSSGWEHAAFLADLDGDRRDELYVAADDQGELRRYVYVDGRFQREVILRRDNARSRMTWNMTVSPVELLAP
ncbi:MAG: VCBS repeat-containing protein, partial [Polyangiaceae bacterium]|nr:VCBS repeat-containing protein [Polyangiaceae bacterium]